MPRVLVDMARSRHYQKREGMAQEVSIDEALEASQDRGADFGAR